MSKRYDVVVLGAGSGGLTAAVGFSKVGKQVLLVEKEHLGGECTNSGCIPSKALLHAAKAGMDGRAALAYVRNTINHIRSEETPAVFEALGIDVVLGEAAFTRKCAVTVGDTEYEYKTAIIATGSSPRLVAIEGLAEPYILTNQNLFELTNIPERLLIIGGGPIGLEMAQAFAELGSQVTIIERAAEFARLEDPAIRPIIRQHLEQLGVTIFTNASVARVAGQTAFIEIETDTTPAASSVQFDNVLLAIGRVPNLPPGLNQAGIQADEHCILVDSQYRTSNKYVYAIGDVSQRLKFTHTADDTARQVVARVMSRGLLKVSRKKVVPKVTYTTPEMAQVGMHWSEAVEKYGEDRVLRIEVPFSQIDRAKTDAATDGLLVVLARRINGQVLGAHIIGPRAGELLAIFSLAIDHKISLWKLQKHIFAYPTYSLIAKKAADQFVGRQVANLKGDVANLLKRNATKVFAAFVWVSALVALHQYQTSSGLSTTEISVRLFDLVTMTAWGPLVYILLYAVRPVTFFPATALTILSGIFFGFVWGTIFTIIAATLAAAVAYGVGRFFGRNLKLEQTALGNWVTALRDNTFSAVLTTRLIFLPFDLISYAAGVLQVKFVSFVLATFLGIILGTATFVSIGASLNLEEFIETGFSFNILETQFLVLSAAIFVVSLALAKVLKRWKAEV